MFSGEDREMATNTHASIAFMNNLPLLVEGNTENDYMVSSVLTGKILPPNYPYWMSQ